MFIGIHDTIHINTFIYSSFNKSFNIYLLLEKGLDKLEKYN